MQEIEDRSRGGSRRSPSPLLLGIIAAFCLQPLVAEEKGAADQTGQIPATIEERIRAIFPHITIDPADRRVDVEAVVCLGEGFLELVACGKDSKEHESLVMVEAKPSHIHAALLLIGAQAGNPAMRKAINEERTRWANIPPRGEPVKVSLVLAKEGGESVERPISDFITPSEDESGLREAVAAGEKFPDTFLFVGSQMQGEGEEKQYFGDYSGHVISIATFGDEVLSLSEVHAQDNGSLAWQIKSESLPAIGTKVILRLRPQWKAKDENAEPSTNPTADPDTIDK
jgi:hypothetical protein